MWKNRTLGVVLGKKCPGTGGPPLPGRCGQVVRFAFPAQCLASGCVWAVNMASHLDRARKAQTCGFEIWGTESLLNTLLFFQNNPDEA